MEKSADCEEWVQPKQVTKTGKSKRKPQIQISKKINPNASISYDESLLHGILALEVINPQEELVVLPNSDFYLGSEPWVEKCMKELQLPHSDKHTALILQLLHEQQLKENSRFHNYILHLPQQVHLPITWTNPQAIESLALTAAQSLLDKEIIESRYTKIIVPLTKNFPDKWPAVSYDTYLWAHSIVSSRAFDFGGQGPFLLPVIDMANHSPELPSAEIVFAENSFKLVARTIIPKHCEVTISYGNLSNIQLLCKYGFLLQDALPDDHILVPYFLVNESCKSILEDDEQAPASTKQNGSCYKKARFQKEARDFIVRSSALGGYCLCDSMVKIINEFYESALSVYPEMSNTTTAEDFEKNVVLEILCRKDSAYCSALKSITNGPESTSAQSQYELQLISKLCELERKKARVMCVKLMMELDNGEDDEDDIDIDDEDIDAVNEENCDA